MQVELDNYNERLFNGKSYRSKLHLARYFWLAKKIKQFGCKTEKILELGCFDGKTIEFIEKPPLEFDGYDANWEGGLDLGKTKWKDFPNYHFNLCDKIGAFKPKENYFDISVCQETMEHLPLADLDRYIERLAKATKSYCFISVPNEKGIVFLVKLIGKKLTQRNRDLERFTLREIFYATVGNVKKVKRRETGHKGFDYTEFMQHVELFFEIVEISGIPFPMLPVSLNFTVGFICKRKSL